jgi:hypothetical protein
MEMKNLLTKLKVERGEEEIEEKVVVEDTSDEYRIQKAISSGRKELKEWIAKLNERSLDRHTVKDLKRMVAENCTVKEFTEKLFELIARK